MFTNEIRPYQSHTHHRNKSCDAFRVAQVGVLDVFYMASGKIDILTLVREKLIVKFLFSFPEVIEDPQCPYPLAGGRLYNPEVMPYTDVIPDASAVQPSDPFLSDELRVHVRGHRASQFMKTDGLHHAQSVKEQRHELYACQIHILSKMLLHNREDLVNFVRVLGSSNFHGEKSPNFSFKLLIFRDFCKYNRLKFRYLTA